MGEVVDPVRLADGHVAFDLEHFEFAGGARFEVRGRWFGVRGRRFMRPSLMLVGDGFHTRLLADLAHKPWAAEDGELWEAAFPTRDGWGDSVEAQLNVTPDVTIMLPVPGSDRKRPRAGRGQQARQSKPRARTQQSSARAGAESDPARRRRETDRERDLSAARELARLRAQIEQLDRELAEVRGASEAQLSAARAEIADALAARDAASAAHQEASAARDEASAARDEASAARAAALADRDRARRERDAAQRERGAAIHQRDLAVAQRDSAIQARERTLSDRDAILLAHDQAAAERDALAQDAERLRQADDQRLAMRGAAAVMHNATIAGARGWHQARWLGFAIGAVCVVIIVLVVALLLH